MVARVPPEGHKNVSLHEDLYDRAERVVEEGDQGYTSLAEFMRAAVRDRLERDEPRLEDGGPSSE